MTIKFVEGDILTSDCAGIVITVNCVGIMGKGLALDAKKKFPEIYPIYKRACRNGELTQGGQSLWISTYRIIHGMPQWAICFPTKDHWRNNSDYANIITSLILLKEDLIRGNISSIAMPPLGCGNGNLNYHRVYDILYDQLDNVATEVNLYAPDLGEDWR